MNTHRPRAWLRTALLLFLLYTVVAAVFTLQVSVATRDANVSIELWQHFLIELQIWLPWALLTPLVLYLVARIRAVDDRWFRQAARHVVVAACLFAVHAVLSWGVGWALVVLLNGKPPVPVAKNLVKFLDMRLLAYGAILGAGFAREYSRQVREKERNAAELEARLARSQLSALKTEIHPHFLFNTLNTVSALIPDDPEAADRVIGLLSELLRTTLEQSDRQEVPLKEEIALLARYLEIQEARFGDRISFRIELQPGTEDAIVPSFILQPLVENAVRHGVAPRREGGTVTVRAERRADTLDLIVADTGSGFAANGDAQGRAGSGLTNVRERLHLLYGQRGELATRHDGGAIVTVSVPYRSSPGVR